MQELLTIRTAFILRLNSNISNMKNRQFFVISSHARDFVLSLCVLGYLYDCVCAVQCAWPWSSYFMINFIFNAMNASNMFLSFALFRLLSSFLLSSPLHNSVHTAPQFRPDRSTTSSIPLHNSVHIAPHLRNFSRLPYLFYWIFESSRAVNIQWMSLLSL